MEELEKLFKINDYELLYLVSWHSEEALNLLLEKYDYLIMKLLSTHHIKYYHYDDYKQECKVALLDAIKRYNPESQKTFCRFAELLIKRRIRRLLDNDTKYGRIIIDTDVVELNPGRENVLEDANNSFYLKRIKEFELKDKKCSVLRDVVFKEVSIDEYAALNDVSHKKVYNDLYAVRRTLKEVFHYGDKD